MSTATSARTTGYVISHYLLTYLGYYGLVATLVVTLTAASFTGPQVALLVMVFTLTNKVANIPLAPWLERIPAANSVLLGCLMAASGFVCLQFATGMPLTIFSLAFAGVGISINALASKQLAAAASDRTGNRARLFSLVSIAVNTAAAVAAPVALMFIEREQQGSVLWAVAAVYCLAGIVTFSRRAILELADRKGPAASPRVFLTILRLPGVRSFLIINFFYWFLYGQLFNVLAVHVSKTLDSPGRLGWLYALNALMVVFLQLSVTHLAQRWTSGQELLTVVRAYALFVVSFMMVYLIPGYLGAVVFVVVFTIAEMMFVPSADVHFLGLIGHGNRAVGYSVFAISTALGEALGGGAGIAAHRWLTDHGFGHQFWLGTAVVALLFTLLTQGLRRSSTGLVHAAPGRVRVGD
ncbi:MFS transporter [Micromonospora sp. CPCC 206060]|uniref:MFS transporter n=1 Tax=Micromonospora sp. CPCC 206060 TaxID=3122406 RepID=UPI002FF32E9B